MESIIKRAGYTNEIFKRNNRPPYLNLLLKGIEREDRIRIEVNERRNEIKARYGSLQ